MSCRSTFAKATQFHDVKLKPKTGLFSVAVIAAADGAERRALELRLDMRRDRFETDDAHELPYLALLNFAERLD